jgi:hypothetical protein
MYIHEEAVIDCYPVDAHIILAKDQEFILQVDGPSHYLHGDGIPQRTPRTDYRDKLLNYFHPVVCIPYFEWQSLKNYNDRLEYVTAKLQKINLFLKKPPKNCDFQSANPNRFFTSKLNFADLAKQPATKKPVPVPINRFTKK